MAKSLHKHSQNKTLQVGLLQHNSVPKGINTNSLPLESAQLKLTIRTSNSTAMEKQLLGSGLMVDWSEKTMIE